MSIYPVSFMTFLTKNREVECFFLCAKLLLALTLEFKIKISLADNLNCI